MTAPKLGKRLGKLYNELKLEKMMVMLGYPPTTLLKLVMILLYILQCCSQQYWYMVLFLMILLVSIVVPLPKGHNANLSDSTNYRGIALSSIFWQNLRTRYSIAMY
jgi:hypothetical protein